MAEYVHQVLEEMIPELEEMNRIGLFTPKETKIIIKNRESHEYKLRQMTKTKSSFLNYIQYEKKLLELIKLRRKKYRMDSRKRDIEKSIADRIHNLYRLLTTRFGEDISLWEQHIEFSKQLNEKAYATRLYDKALKIHSHNEDLWVKAAQWESSMEGNANSELAREILLKGQRVNPESEVIFLQMYYMELALAKQILKRKKVLGLPATAANKEGNGLEEDKVAELKLAEIVYRKGIELFPGNAEFHMKLLHTCCQFKEAKSHEQLIVEDLRRLHPHSPVVWNGLALRHLNNLKKISPAERKQAVIQCLDTYKEAVDKVPTEEMWTLCLRGHLRILHLKEVSDTEFVLKFTLTMFETAIQRALLSEDHYVELLELLSSLSMYEDLAKVAESGTEQHPNSAHLWLARLKEMSKEEGTNESEFDKMLKTALKKVKPEESWPIWQFGLNHYAAQKYAGLEELMERACRSVTSQVCNPAKEWCLHWTYRQGGLQKARAVYNSLKHMRPISLQFYRLYVQIECSQLEPSLLHIRTAFEEALVEFGPTETDLWLNYMEMERQVAKDASKSGEVQHRALNALDPHLKESFIRKQVMLGLAN